MTEDMVLEETVNKSNSNPKCNVDNVLDVSKVDNSGDSKEIHHTLQKCYSLFLYLIVH